MIYVILFVHNHCGWRWIVDLAAWLPQVAPRVVIMTTHGATGGCRAVGLTTLDFQWRYRLTIYHDVYMCVIIFANIFHVNLLNKRLLNLNLTNDYIGNWIRLCACVCVVYPQHKCLLKTLVSEDCQVSIKLGATLSAMVDISYLVLRPITIWISYQTCCSRSCL